MGLLKTICSRSLSQTNQVVEILPSINLKSYVECPEKYINAHIDCKSMKDDEKYSIIHYNSTDDLNSRTESINNALVQVCSNINNKMYGIASLPSNNMDASLEQFNKLSKSPFIKGFKVNCIDIANKCQDYKRNYHLFEKCADADFPILFSKIPNSSNMYSMFIIGQAVCSMINDGIFDFYPNLKVIIPAEIVPLIVEEQKNNNPANSLQKHPIEVYFEQNIYCISSFSDAEFLSYYIKKFGDNNIICVPSEDESQYVTSMPSISQLSMNKIMGLNAIQLFRIENESSRWSLNRDNITVIDSLQCVKLLSSKLRDTTTNSHEFMLHSDRLMTVLAEEALARVPFVTETNIETPTGNFRGLQMAKSKNLCVVSIIRSGDILLEAVRKLEPGIKVGKILIQRDEETVNKEPVLYYKKLPRDISNCYVLVVDPMLATGGSFLCAIDVLVENGVQPKNIMFVNLFSVEEGLHAVQAKFPDIKIVTLYIDDYLNEDKYIVPGVGDFGDRYYGTVDG